LIIFTHSFCNDRGGRNKVEAQRTELNWIRDATAVKIAMPQDEFHGMRWMCDFINDFKIDCVFSVAPESEWSKIYRTVDFSRVRFYRVLTGYLDPEQVKRVQSWKASESDRCIDIGYRSGANPWWGRLNLQKQLIAERFTALAPAHALTTNIALGWDKFLSGDAWLRFLTRCRYIPGVEGGASILDWDGSVRAKVDAYRADHPRATFAEIESECFPGADWEIRVVALSPRHLEACLTRTCQVLIEGEYNGVLEPGSHYIPLKPDFSNINDVLRLISTDSVRSDITSRAYQDVVASGRYSYPRFVSEVIRHSFEGMDQPRSTSSWWETAIYRWNCFADWLTWGWVWVWSRGRDLRDWCRPRR
jgi:hypothetical protein